MVFRDSTISSIPRGLPPISRLSVSPIPAAAEPTWDTLVLSRLPHARLRGRHAPKSALTHPTAPSGTFYWALAEGSPAQNRQLLLDKDWNYWTEAILRDLERVHSDIRQCVSRLDVMRMGHAMIRPAVGSVFSEERRRLTRRDSSDGRLLFANSRNLSSISIFEEAQILTAFSPRKPPWIVYTATVNSATKTAEPRPRTPRQVFASNLNVGAYYISGAFLVRFRKE